MNRGVPVGANNIGVGFMTAAYTLGDSSQGEEDPPAVILTAKHLFEEDDPVADGTADYARVTFPYALNNVSTTTKLRIHPLTYRLPVSPFYGGDDIAVLAVEDEGVRSSLRLWKRPASQSLSDRRGEDLRVLGVNRVQSSFLGGEIAFARYEIFLSEGKLSNVSEQRISVSGAEGYEGLSGGVIFDRDCLVLGMVVGGDPHSGQIVGIGHKRMELYVGMDPSVSK